MGDRREIGGASGTLEAWCVSGRVLSVPDSPFLSVTLPLLSVILPQRRRVLCDPRPSVHGAAAASIWGIKAEAGAQGRRRETNEGNAARWSSKSQ